MSEQGEGYFIKGFEGRFSLRILWKKVMVLIDKYDVPIINAFDKGYYNEAINFFQVFYSSILKTNDSLKKEKK